MNRCRFVPFSLLFSAFLVPTKVIIYDAGRACSALGQSAAAFPGPLFARGSEPGALGSMVCGGYWCERRGRNRTRLPCRLWAVNAHFQAWDFFALERQARLLDPA